MTKMMVLMMVVAVVLMAVFHFCAHGASAGVCPQGVVAASRIVTTWALWAGAAGVNSCANSRAWRGKLVCAAVAPWRRMAQSTQTRCCLTRSTSGSIWYQSTVSVAWRLTSWNV